MFILHLLPTFLILWVVNILFTAGLIITIAGWAINSVPFITQYKLPIQIVGVLLLVCGVYFKGGYEIEKEWRERVEVLQSKVTEAEQKSTKINTVIKKVYVTKYKVIKKDRIVIQDRIVKEAAVIDKDCKVSPSAISILNDAAKPTKASVEVGPLGKDTK